MRALLRVVPLERGDISLARSPVLPNRPKSMKFVPARVHRLPASRESSPDPSRVSACKIPLRYRPGTSGLGTSVRLLHVVARARLAPDAVGRRLFLEPSGE